MPKEFVVPGENQLSAALDVARTVIRRAERIAVSYPLEESLVVAYLNRLSDLAWTMARFAEGPHHRTARQH
jgi:cob(I)alamin adenosyltransferase